MSARTLLTRSILQQHSDYPHRAASLRILSERLSRAYASRPKLEPIGPPRIQEVRVLEKPDRFRPASHPSRAPKQAKPRHFPGPPLSEAELAAQKTKRYPNMFPPEGTRMHWFLTAKWMHAGIALGILITLCLSLVVIDFRHQNLYPELLPPASLFWSGHPIAYLQQYIQVYRMHMHEESRRSSIERSRHIDDALKRKKYLKEHGQYKLLFGFLGDEPDKDGEKRREEGDSADGAKAGERAVTAN